METLFSYFSDWDSTSVSLNNETCQRAGYLKVDDQCPLLSQSMTKNQSRSTEFRQKTLIDREEMKNAAVFLVGNSMSHHLCQSQLPENRESKQGNAEAQGTQPCATRARPYHHSHGSELAFVAKSTLCWLLLCNLQPNDTSSQGVCILPLTIVI